MLTLRSKAFFLILVYGQSGCFPTSHRRQLVCAQCSSMQPSTDRAAYIVAAGNVLGLRFVLNLHNQINAAPLAVQFCPLDWLGSFVLNSLTTNGAELPGRFMLAIPELIWGWKSSATIPTPILFYDIGAFLCNVRYHPSDPPLTRPARTAWGRLDRDFYSCRSACNRSQRSRNCLAAGHN